MRGHPLSSVHDPSCALRGLLREVACGLPACVKCWFALVFSHFVLFSFFVTLLFCFFF